MSDNASTSAQGTDAQRNLRRTLYGRVTSSAGKKTITVKVQRTFKHPKYGKYVRKSKSYHAHDEQETARAGDLVEIAATRPISKLKRWRLLRVVDAATVADLDAGLIEEATGGGAER